MTDPDDKINHPDYVRAKIALVQAQVIGQNFDNRMAEALAETAEIAARRETVKHVFDQAGPSYHRVFYMTGEITASLSERVMDTLGRWDRMDSDNPDRAYTIVMSSPGGDVISGFQLYSFLKGLAQRRTITISAAGMCASMATIIHQAASEGCRIIEPGCSYLLHKVSGGMSGRSDTITDTAAWMEQLNKSMAEIFAERGNYSAEEVAEKTDRREMYLTPEEVVGEWGLADEIKYTSY